MIFKSIITSISNICCILGKAPPQESSIIDIWQVSKYTSGCVMMIHMQIIFIIMNYSFNDSWPAHTKGRHFKRHVVLFERSFSTVFSIRFSPNYFLSFTEAFVRRCSVKKVFLNISSYSQENICVGAYFLIKLMKVCNCIKKRLQRSWFHVNIEKFLGTPILKNICERLLLQIIHWKLMLSFHISWKHQKNFWLSDIFTVREKISNTKFFLVRVFLYNTDQKKLRTGTLFMQQDV